MCKYLQPTVQLCGALFEHSLSVSEVTGGLAGGNCHKVIVSLRGEMNS